MRTVFTVFIIMLLCMSGHVMGASVTSDTVKCIADIGSGPMSRIQSLSGYEFDWGYMLTMYQQNSDIEWMALLGAEKACDGSIRKLSEKIAMERAEMNLDLKQWYSIYVNRVMPKADYARYLRLEVPLTRCCDIDFDRQYITIMIALMQQSLDAADYAVDEVITLQLQQQARVVSRTNENEISALRGWLIAHS